MSSRTILTVLTATALAVLVSACGPRIQHHPRLGQFATTEEISAGTYPARSLTAPEGKVFLVYYATRSLGGTYRARDWEFKAQTKTGENIVPYGTRVEAVFCPVDMMTGNMGPQGTPFTVLPEMTTVSMGGQAECLSLLFVIPHEDIEGLKILRKLAGSWRAERVLSESGRWSGPQTQ
jgi:hypothetical protein